MRHILVAMLALIMSSIAVAGPARDRAQVVMDGLQGAAVTTQQGAKILAAYEWRYSDQLPMTMVDDEVVRMQPGDLNVEESSQFYLDINRTANINTLNRYQVYLKRAELQVDQDTIESQVAGVIVTDL